MRKSELVRVRHALDAARKAMSLARGRTREDVRTDEMFSLSLIRLLEVIGEAGAATSKEFRGAHPEIPWRKMVALRNRLIHRYFDINLDIVWDTVVDDLPTLVEELDKILEAKGGCRCGGWKEGRRSRLGGSNGP